MLIGYARVSKSDGSQNLDLQIDALIKKELKKKTSIMIKYQELKKKNWLRQFFKSS